jgi:hypothetical protein
MLSLSLIYFKSSPSFKWQSFLVVNVLCVENLDAQPFSSPDIHFSELLVTATAYLQLRYLWHEYMYKSFPNRHATFDYKCKWFCGLTAYTFRRILQSKLSERVGRGGGFHGEIWLLLVCGLWHVFWRLPIRILVGTHVMLGVAQLYRGNFATLS